MDCILETQKNKSGYLIEFGSYSDITNKNYSMFAIFGVNCKLTHIDKFLKKNGVSVVDTYQH